MYLTPFADVSFSCNFFMIVTQLQILTNYIAAATLFYTEPALLDTTELEIPERYGTTLLLSNGLFFFLSALVAVKMLGAAPWKALKRK